MLLFSKIKLLKYFLPFLSIFLFISAFGQENKVVISGKINNINSLNKSISIYSFFGTEMNFVDSTKINKKGKFCFNINVPNHAGYYRLVLEKDNYTDIIIKPNEDILIEFSNGKLNDWKKVKKSNENTILLESRNKSKLAKDKQSAFKELKLIAEKKPNTFFSKLTLSYLPFEIFTEDTFPNELSRMTYISNHYFDNVDFSSSSLVYSTLLPNIYMRYFENYTEYNEEGFKKSIDIIMKKSEVNSDIFQFTLDFMIQLFKKVGPEIILEYVIDNYYFNYSCGELSTNVETKKIIEDYGKIQVGKEIPNFNFTLYDTLKDSLNIKNICQNNEAVLLIFWSSYCHYCEIKAPFWNYLSSKFENKGLKIIYFSLDTELDDLKKGITDKKLKGIHSCDFQGWKGAIPQLLNINRTPYPILLSKEAKIILKDATDDQIKLYLSNLFN